MSLIFFFFSSRRRHTRLTCDWSSDVCSSDLKFFPTARQHVLPCRWEEFTVDNWDNRILWAAARRLKEVAGAFDSQAATLRSEERRVGKEGRSRWWPGH